MPRLPRPPRLPRSPLFLRHCLRYNSTSSPARTRFAPSPTGFLHLGSLRTALLNYLLAHSTSGQFLLRIEDTDSKRTVPGAVSSILETLNWASLNPSELHVAQSTRKDQHIHHVNLLLESSHAYRCFCTRERLSALALLREKAGLPTDYDRTCLSIPVTESDSRARAGEQFVIRLKAPEKYPDFVDEVYGKLSAGENSRAHAASSYEDPILLKSDGSPTYHLANVVDDHEMGITHVVRATEWLPSTPKHMFLYQCFGWKPPKWVHVGLLQDTNKRKLSKRSGDVFVSEFKEKGYLPEALVNFVALLGWGAGGESATEVMTVEEMVRRFDIGRLTPGNTVVDFGKLEFLQKAHLRRIMEDDPKGPRAKEILKNVEKAVRREFGDKLEDGSDLSRKFINKVVHTNLQNLVVPDQFARDSAFFFVEPDLDSKAAATNLRKAKKFLNEKDMRVDALMTGFLNRLGLISDNWDTEKIQPVVEQGENEEREAWRARMRLARFGLTGGEPGPNLAATMAVLGKPRTMTRLVKAVMLVAD